MSVVLVVPVLVVPLVVPVLVVPVLVVPVLVVLVVSPRRGGGDLAAVALFTMVAHHRCRHVAPTLTGVLRASFAVIVDVRGWTFDRPDLDRRDLDARPASRVGGRAVPEPALVSPVVVAAVEDRLVAICDHLNSWADHHKIGCRDIAGHGELASSGATARERHEQYRTKN